MQWCIHHDIIWCKIQGDSKDQRWNANVEALRKTANTGMVLPKPFWVSSSIGHQVLGIQCLAANFRQPIFGNQYLASSIGHSMFGGQEAQAQCVTKCPHSWPRNIPTPYHARTNSGRDGSVTCCQRSTRKWYELVPGQMRECNVNPQKVNMGLQCRVTASVTQWSYLPDCGDARQVLSSASAWYNSTIMWSQRRIMHLHLHWHDTAMLIRKLELNENTNHCESQLQPIQ